MKYAIGGVWLAWITLISGFVVEKSRLLQRTTTVLSQIETADAYGEAEISNNRKMELMWCDEALCKDVVREKVIGDHNSVILTGPATGQVAYQWATDNKAAKVLLLVRPGDEELCKIAAEAVQNLAQKAPEVQVYMDALSVARLQHIYGVGDAANIHLFEHKETPGFGNDINDNEIEHSAHTFSDVAFLQQYMHTNPDLICTLGGDGSVMYAAMLFQGPVPPIMSINGGSMGFLTPFEIDEMSDAILSALGVFKNRDYRPSTSHNKTTNVFEPSMAVFPYEPLDRVSMFGRNDHICISIRMRLECTVFNKQGSPVCRYNVLNEVVVDRGSSPYLAALECFCDDNHLTTVQADGIIFATPTGSTAYSMAAGGSVVHPAVPCILVTPICPHVLSFRSMVFPDHVVLTCVVPPDARSGASVAFDGKHRQDLRRGDYVQIKMSPYPVPTINRKDHSADWLYSLKHNFNFNTRPRQRPLS